MRKLKLKFLLLKTLVKHDKKMLHPLLIIEKSSINTSPIKISGAINKQHNNPFLNVTYLISLKKTPVNKIKEVSYTSNIKLIC